MFELRVFSHIRAYTPEYTKQFTCGKAAVKEADRLCMDKKPAAVYKETGELVFRGYPNPYNPRERAEADKWDDELYSV